MKTAKELFEELGYEENNDRETYQRYTKKTEFGNLIEISFSLQTKNFIKQIVELDLALYITPNELKAINQQIKELGWND